MAKHLDGGSAYYGFALLALSLIADGFLPDYQAKIKTEYHPPATEMYERVNRWEFLFCISWGLITGQLFQISSFIVKHPRLLYDILLEAIMNAVGQLFAYYLISHFRQHVVPFVITTRKAISMLLSITVFGHTVKSMQWVGIGLVFAGVSV